MKAEIVMDAKGIGCKVLISAPGVAEYKIGYYACNKHVNQVLFFIAEEAAKISNVKDIEIMNYPMTTKALLFLEIEICESIYGSHNFYFDTPEDAEPEQEPQTTKSNTKSVDIDIEGWPTEGS